MTKILLVEDNFMIQEILSERLSIRGFDVLVAGNGRQAVDIALQEKPDLILMDLSLPVLNGLDATRQIRADEAGANIPIIALTAHALEEDRKKSMQAGCDDFETKPIHFAQLLEKIETLLPPEKRFE